MILVGYREVGKKHYRTALFFPGRFSHLTPLAITWAFVLFYCRYNVSFCGKYRNYLYCIANQY